MAEHPKREPSASIRPEILRRYHEATFGGRPLGAEAIEDATFEEYFALSRIAWPRITAWRAAMNAPRADLRELAKELPADAAPAQALPRFDRIERKPEVNLAEAVEGVSLDVERLVIERIPRVSGWRALRTLGALDDLAVVLCASERAEAVEPPLELRALALTSCGLACVETLVRGTRAGDLTVRDPETTVLDARLFAGQRRLRALRVGAPLVRHVGALSELRLVKLGLGSVEPDAELGRALAALAGTLEELSLTGSRPFGPEVLPALPRLGRLRAPGYAEHRAEWIEFAVAHPAIACELGAVEPPAVRRAQVSVEAIHRGIDLLRVVKGGRVTFEIAADVAGALPGFGGDNGDLEDVVRAAAKAAKKSVAWGSERDTLVARAASPDLLRWVLDAAFDSAGRAASPKRPAPRRKASTKR